MSRRLAAVLAALVAGTMLLAATSATSVVGATSPRQADEQEPRARDLEYRVRDLQYRWRTRDNSERVAQTGDKTTITFSADVLFAFDRAELTPQARRRLDDVAQTLRDLGPRTVTIEGHTDSVGDTAYNQDLSLRRAEAVRAALEPAVGAGFSFEVAGLGEDRPVAPNQHDDGSDNPEGRAVNRRVEISFPTD